MHKVPFITARDVDPRQAHVPTLGAGEARRRWRRRGCFSLGLAVVCAACGGGGNASVEPAAMQPNATGTTASGMTSVSAAGDATGAAGMTTARPAAGSSATTVAGSAGASSSAMSTSGGGSAPRTAAGSGGGGEPPASGGAGAAAGMDASAGAAGMATADSDAPMPSLGCMGGSLKPGRTTGSIQSSGGNRTYIQYIPQSYDGMTPVPLVVDLHPYSVDASFSESSSGFRQLADTEGYMYLAPNGIGNMWDSVGDTDEKFIRDLVNDVASKGCIDLRRVYATGCSNGGAFSFLLMCTAEDIFAAVAPMCGTAFFDLETQCELDRPVSLMLRIGKQDTLNCWEGEGMDLNAPNVPAGTKVQCAKTVQKVLGDKYHCKGEIQQEAECEYLGDCDEGTEIAICDENTGHVVYTATTARDTWAFLKRFYKH